MLKINYPNNRTNLHNDYVTTLDITANDRDEYLRFHTMLSGHIPGILLPRTLDQLLVADFGSLVRSSLQLNALFQNRPNIFNVIREKFKYDNFDDKIAKFFMTKSEIINLRTCYYCNIDFVNAFVDIFDYRDAFHFLKNASQSELEKVKGIGESRAIQIISQRDTVNSIDQFSFDNKSTIVNNIQNRIFKKSHSHFTIDHVLNKALHPIAALSLYNFVPACYSCNSKFKKDLPIVTSAANSYMSPTHPDFVFSDSVKFEIFFNIHDEIIDIENVSDFLLDFAIDSSLPDYSEYIRVFKLKGRYVFHKKVVVDLILKAKKYPDSQLFEISGITGIATDTIRNDIFGEELFENSVEEVPLTKLKRDIGEKAGIRGIR